MSSKTEGGVSQHILKRLRSVQAQIIAREQIQAEYRARIVKGTSSAAATSEADREFVAKEAAALLKRTDSLFRPLRREDQGGRTLKTPIHGGPSPEKWTPATPTAVEVWDYGFDTIYTPDEGLFQDWLTVDAKIAPPSDTDIIVNARSLPRYGGPDTPKWGFNILIGFGVPALSAGTHNVTGIIPIDTNIYNPSNWSVDAVTASPADNGTVIWGAKPYMYIDQVNADGSTTEQMIEGTPPVVPSGDQPINYPDSLHVGDNQFGSSACVGTVNLEAGKETLGVLWVQYKHIPNGRFGGGVRYRTRIQNPIIVFTS